MCDTEMLLEYGLVGAFNTCCLMRGEDVAIVEDLVDCSVGEDDEFVADDGNVTDFRGISFLEIQIYSEQLAAQLYHRFGARGEPILVICKRHPAPEIVAMLACIRIASPFIPVDESWLEIEQGQQRLASIVEDSRPFAAVIVGFDDRDDAVQQLARLGIFRCALINADGSPVPFESSVADIRDDLPPIEYQNPNSDEMDEGAHANTSATSSKQKPLYILYTSGSSGPPKGVLGTQAGLLNRIAFGMKLFPWGPNEVVLRRTPLTFVDALVEIFSPLVAAVPLWAPPRNLLERSGLAAVAAEASRIGVTRVTLLPSQLNTALVQQPVLCAMWSSLSKVFVSGEACPIPLCRAFERLLPRATLVNMYGSTEVAGDVACAILCSPLDTATTPAAAVTGDDNGDDDDEERCWGLESDEVGREERRRFGACWPQRQEGAGAGAGDQESDNGKTGHGSYPHSSCPIGFALDNNALLVVREREGEGERESDVNGPRVFEEVPAGQTGELLVVGAHVAIGYHNNPRETASRFLADPIIISSSTTGSAGKGGDGNDDDDNDDDNDNGVTANLHRRHVSGGAYFRTGDLVTVDPITGAMTWMGRRDLQVKIRGVRIELEEAESNIKRAFGGMLTGAEGWASGAVEVSGIAVVASSLSSTTNGEASASATLQEMKLVLFVEDALVLALASTLVSTSHTAIGTDALGGEGSTIGRKDSRVDAGSIVQRMRDVLVSRLLPAFVPTLVLPLDALPRTTSGKVDRVALHRRLDALLQAAPLTTHSFESRESSAGADVDAGNGGLTGLSHQSRGMEEGEGDYEGASSGALNGSHVNKRKIGECSSSSTSLPTSLFDIRSSMLEIIGVILPHLRLLNQSYQPQLQPEPEPDPTVGWLHQDFFSLGGDSATAIELLWRINQRFGTALAFHHLTLPLSQLADLVAGAAVETASEGEEGVEVEVEVEVEAATEPVTASTKKKSTNKSSDIRVRADARSLPVIVDAAAADVQSAVGMSSDEYWTLVGWTARSGTGTLGNGLGPGAHIREHSPVMPFTTGNAMGDHDYPPLVHDGPHINVKVTWSVPMRKCVDSSPLIVTYTRHFPTHSAQAIESPSPGGKATEEVTVLFAGCHGGDFVAVDCGSGEVLWRKYLGHHMEGSAACDPTGLIILVPTYAGNDVHGAVEDASERAQPEGSGREGADDKDGGGGGQGGCLLALDAKTGSLLWQRRLPAEIKGAPAVDVQRSEVLVGCHDGRLHHFRCDDGSPLGSIDCGGSIFSSPLLLVRNAPDALGQDKPKLGGVVVCTTNGKVQRIDFVRDQRDMATGEEECDGGGRMECVWVYEAEAPVFSSPIAITIPANHKEGADVEMEQNQENRELIAFGVVDGTLRCLDALSGALVWISYATRPVFSSPCVISLPLLLPTIPHFDCDEEEDNEEKHGEGLMASSTSNTLSPVIVFGAHDNILRCVSALDGAEIWSTDLGAVVFASPCGMKETSRRVVAAATTAGDVVVVDAGTGQVEGRSRLPAEIYSSPVSAGGNIFVGCRDDRIYCIVFHEKPLTTS